MIDTKQRKAFEAEYAAILASRRNTLFFDDDGDKQVAEQIVGLSIRIHEAVTRAVIAEHEAAKSAPQPVADVDVPEWVKACASDVWTGGTKADYRKKIHAHAESEISRRVAEAEANNDTLRDNSRECRQECVELRQQLAAAQAEVSRLTKLNETPRSFDEAVHGVQSMIDAMGSMDRNRKEIAKLREEVSRLSRPVEDVEWCNIVIGLCGIDDIPARVHQVTHAKKTVEPLLQRERNARESAEAERDELRAVIVELADRLETDGHTRLHSACWKCDIYHKLAAFRAERAKVVT